MIDSAGHKISFPSNFPRDVFLCFGDSLIDVNMKYGGLILPAALHCHWLTRVTGIERNERAFTTISKARQMLAKLPEFAPCKSSRLHLIHGDPNTNNNIAEMCRHSHIFGMGTNFVDTELIVIAHILARCSNIRLYVSILCDHHHQHQQQQQHQIRSFDIINSDVELLTELNFSSISHSEPCQTIIRFYRQQESAKLRQQQFEWRLDFNRSQTSLIVVNNDRARKLNDILFSVPLNFEPNYINKISDDCRIFIHTSHHWHSRNDYEAERMDSKYFLRVWKNADDDDNKWQIDARFGQELEYLQRQQQKNDEQNSNISPSINSTLYYICIFEAVRFIRRDIEQYKNVEFQIVEKSDGRILLQLVAIQNIARDKEIIM